MSEIKVVDLEGRWVVNPHAYPFPDPETGVRFEPKVPTKVKVDKGSWVAGQIEAKALIFAPDPMKPEKEPPKASGKAEG